MTTQLSEILGEVVGWVILVDQGARQEISTLDEWREFRKSGKGGIYYTRIQGPSGIEEQMGANAETFPLGTKMIQLTCKDCQGKTWFEYPFLKEVTREDCSCCGDF